MTSRTTLVTGGAGYVGSMLVGELVARGHHVRVLDSLTHGGAPSLLPVWGHPRFEFHRGDVRDEGMRRRALAGVHAVVHLAAIVGDPACARQPDLAEAVNFDATRDLLADAKELGVARFVFASTCSNYGKVPDDVHVTEEAALRPVSVYAETKVAAEEHVLRASSNGLSSSCLRFATVYGTSARMRFDLTVNEFTRDVCLARSLVVFGEQFWRPYIHVRDAAAAIALVLDAPPKLVAGEVFNVGATSENYRKLDIVDLLRARFQDAVIEFVHKDEDPRDYRVSFEKIRESLGFEPKKQVADGIDEITELLRSKLLDDPYAPAYRN